MDTNSSVVRFCILRRARQNNDEIECLLMPKMAYEPSFPSTKFRENEDLYKALYTNPPKIT